MAFSNGFEFANFTNGGDLHPASGVNDEKRDSSCYKHITPFDLATGSRQSKLRTKPNGVLAVEIC